jgi:DNA replication protein DnaC
VSGAANTAAVIIRERCGAPWQPGGCQGRVLLLADQDHDATLLEAVCERCDARYGIPATKISSGAQIARLTAQAQIPPRFQTAQLQSQTARRTAKTLEQWVQHFPSRPLPAPALWGETGTGKTLLLCHLLKRLINTHRTTARFWAVRSLLRTLQRFNDPTERDRTWQQACTVGVLALDDLGAPRESAWRIGELSDLIDERYDHNRPLLLTTNYPPSRWGLMMDQRTASRLAEMTFAVQVRDEDWRRRNTTKPGESER